MSGGSCYKDNRARRIVNGVLMKPSIRFRSLCRAADGRAGRSTFAYLAVCLRAEER